ncbi:hypothetical protein ACOME3_010352 [Neoechinorhynchus agilis]
MRNCDTHVGQDFVNAAIFNPNDGNNCISCEQESSSVEELDKINGDPEHFQRIAGNIRDANVNLEEMVTGLQRDQEISKEFILWSAASAYRCDFVVNTEHSENPRRIRSRVVTKTSYNVWIDESGCYPCERSRGLNRRQSLELMRRRYRTLYFNNTSRLANQIFKSDERRQPTHNSDSIVQHLRSVFEGTHEYIPAPRLEHQPGIPELWHAVTAEEIEAAMKGIKSNSELGNVELDTILDGDNVKYLGNRPWKNTEVSSAIEEVNWLFNWFSPTQSAHLLNDYGIFALISSLQAAHDLSITALEQLEHVWRTRLKKLLFLPHSTNDGIMFLPLSRGGLGFTSIKYSILTARLNCLNAVERRYPELIKETKQKTQIDNYLLTIGGASYNKSSKTMHQYFIRNQENKWRQTSTQSQGIDAFTNGHFDH